MAAREQSSLVVGGVNSHRLVAWLILPLLVLSLPSTASAHTETGALGGFISGFVHPLTGLDHVVAMVAVGLWGAFLGMPAIWILPVVFPVVMALGGALGVLGVPMPGVETGIALSGVILGLMVAFAAKPPLKIAGSDCWDFRHLSRPRAWHGASGSSQRFDVCRGIRDRNGLAAP